MNDAQCVNITECLACGSNQLELILDLNNQPLANSYKVERDDYQAEYPLAINHCRTCHHVQLTHAVNPDLMFKDYLYVSGTSQTMNDHFEWFARYSKEYFEALSDEILDTVLDIGCNDGSQLNHFISDTIETYGVDPAENLAATSRAKGHDIHVGYFDEAFVKIAGMYDIVIAQNVFAHNYDPLTFLNNAKNVMSRDSLLFIQTSQADMIRNNEFDTIYHEHISFYNINSMNELCKRAGLNLIDVVKCPLHGNSYIFTISKYEQRKANIDNLIEMESFLLKDETYNKYAENCNKIIETLYNQIQTAKASGYKIVGYGAAAKGMTLLNAAGLNNDDFDFIVDDNPLKQGRFTPGSNIEIVSSDVIPSIASEDCVMFVPLAWNFFKEIRMKIKQKRDNANDVFLTYFPEVSINP